MESDGRLRFRRWLEDATRHFQCVRLQGQRGGLFLPRPHLADGAALEPRWKPRSSHPSSRAAGVPLYAQQGILNGSWTPLTARLGRLGVPYGASLIAGSEL